MLQPCYNPVTTQIVSNVTTRYNPKSPSSSSNKERINNNTTTGELLEGVDYSEPINALLSIEGIDNATFPVMSLTRWLTKNNSYAAHAMDTAIALKGAVQYQPKTGTWCYWSASGTKRHYTDLAAVFQKWMSRPRLAEYNVNNKEAVNGKRGRATVLDGTGWANQYQG